MRVLFAITGLLFYSLSVYAQQSLLMPWASFRENPAYTEPDTRWWVSLPSTVYDISLDELSYSDIVVNSNGNNVIDINRAIRLLKPDNQFTQNLNIQTLGIGRQGDRFFASVGHQVQVISAVQYPRALPQLIWQGNEAFIGETVDVAPDVALRAWHRFDAQAGIKLSEQFSVGMRLGAVYGISDNSTAASKLLITTNAQDYSLQVDADLAVRTTGEIVFNGWDDVNIALNPRDYDIDKVITKNTGYSLDFGVHFRNDTWNAQAYVANLGQIRWKDDVKQYRLQGVYNYSGLDVTPSVLYSTPAEFGDILDTLQQRFPVTEESVAYTTSLQPAFQADVCRTIGATLAVGASVRLQEYANTWRPQYSVGAQWSPVKAIQVVASLQQNQTQNWRLGLGAGLKLGPVRASLGTHHLGSIITPKSSSQGSFWFSSGLVF